MATRWGICSAGKISHDFVVALSTLPPEEHVVHAVAARDVKRSQQFADLHKIPNAYGSYEELAADKDVDVVYIGALHTQHLDIGKLMLNHGKPVLCEKPLVMNLREGKELIDLARKRKVFLLEAVWSRFFPVYEDIRKELAAGSIGDVIQVDVAIGRHNAEVDRVKMKDLGGGSLLVLGVYALQFAMLVLGAKRPKDIVALGNLTPEGVDMNVAWVMAYEGGKTAVLSSHSAAFFSNEALITGTKGVLRVANPFWCPTKYSTPEKNVEFPLPEARLKCNFDNSTGLRYEAMEVRRCLQQGLLESPKMTLEESLMILEVSDIIRNKIGVKYSQDDA